MLIFAELIYHIKTTISTSIKMKRDNTTPMAGSIRTIEKFLIVPKTLGNKTKWLSTARIKQRYAPKSCAGHITFQWKDVNFLD